VKVGGRCSAMLAALVFLAACEKPVHLTTPPPPGAQTAPVTLSFTDTPPTGVLVLSFQLTFTGATLQPGNVSLLSSPVTLEASSLQTTAADLGTTNVPVGTYSSVSFNVASPVLTISNQSGATVAGCTNNTICKLTGSATPTTISLTVSLTATANTPVGLLADLNLNNIIQSDLSLTLDSTSFSLSVLPPAAIPLTGTLQTIEGFLGQVTALGTNQFTLTNAPSGLSLAISVTPGTTVFQNFDTLGCTASPQNFSCVQVGQVVAADLNVLGNGTLAATTVDAQDAPPTGQEDLEGVLVATGPLANQFQMVVLDEEPIVTGISVGDSVLVNIALPAGFSVDTDGLTVSGFTFASASDLLVGQEIQVQVTTVVLNPSPPPAQQVNTSRVRLRMSQFSASVNTVNASTGTFTVNALAQSGLPAMVATGTVTASTSSQTEFNPSSLTVSTLNVADTVSLRGLLFNPTGGPTLVTRNVRKR
jgi:hypothetical protein